VSTATASDLTAPVIGGHQHFLLRRLHSLTGIVFGGYLVVHLIVNATMMQAGSVFQWQVDKIHSLPFLWAIEWLFIYLPIIYHTIYGIWIAATGQPNVSNYGYGKNWAYFMQRISGIVIVLFLVFHVLSFKYGTFNFISPSLQFDPHDAARTVHTHMTVGFWVAWIIYPLGIIASCFHMANGFWTAGITWGLTVSAGAQRRWGGACAGLFLMTMVLGFVALVASVNWTPPPPDAPVIVEPSIIP
jgi:succinate dehydrogenase / fumarate reductase, cytochrome b subunit